MSIPNNTSGLRFTFDHVYGSTSSPSSAMFEECIAPLVDGTTCATVLTRAIFTERCKSVAAGMNDMDLRRGITMAVDAVVTNLKSRARMISTSEEIAQSLYTWTVLLIKRHVTCVNSKKNRTQYDQSRRAEQTESFQRSFIALFSSFAIDRFSLSLSLSFSLSDYSDDLSSILLKNGVSFSKSIMEFEDCKQGEETNMSNSIGHNLVNQSLVQSKLNSSGIPANTLFQTPSFNQVATRPRKSQSSKDFSGSSLVIRKSKLAMGSRRSTVPRAVLATVKLLSCSMEKVGKEGVITIQLCYIVCNLGIDSSSQNSANFMHDGKTLYNELEVVEGMKLDQGYISPYFITNQKTKNELEDRLIRIHEKKISSINAVVKKHKATD
ncbi:hypothetical protein F8388_010529 [Cannabis sativa]|uniref:Uncharacterized protein n=1 Tax=Cannabis sativa TaxID=3483 RepID=A0A7J6GQ21_CANSA|nr:hypothetical protein G4B88_016826 [Cannabis sativa]KAF4384931.1 hypothetical protein F8388_010529 [Cannabis sativa]